MKKIQFIVLLAAITCGNLTATNAQTKRSNGQVTPVKVGTVLLNIGVGVGAEYKGDYYNTAPAIKAALEFGLWQAGPGVITLGAAVGGSTSKGGFYYNDYKSSTIVIAGRSAWHYGWKVRGLDTYAGLSAGIGFHNYNYVNNNKKDQVIPVLGGFVGASYFVTPRFGFNVEAGYDITSFQGGVVFKLK
jgi:hypothetical protein